MQKTDSVVLITGCSSGIGKALALEFLRQGYQVVATARKIETLTDLAEKGMLTARLDVNQSGDIQKVMDLIEKKFGRLDVLVNNAGYALIGPAIDVSDEEMQLQFQTNVFAPLALTRLAVPLMKTNGGKVVNMGSISGIVTTPFSAAYCASKAALHSLSDALRMELAPFNIQVITIQPGAIKSAFGDNAAKKASHLLRPDSAYMEIADHIEQRAQISQQDTTPAHLFARKVVGKIVRPQSPWLYRTGKKSFYLPLIKKLLPQRVLDRMMVKKFGLAEL